MKGWVRGWRTTDDYIQGYISEPCTEGSFNPIMECEIYLTQITNPDDMLIEGLNEITFPARKLRKLLKYMPKSKSRSSYEITKSLTLVKYSSKKYVLESNDLIDYVIIKIIEIDEMIELLEDLLSMFDEMVKKY